MMKASRCTDNVKRTYSVAVAVRRDGVLSSTVLVTCISQVHRRVMLPEGVQDVPGQQ